MRQSKQSRIDELERILKIEQEGLRSEKANLQRLTANWDSERKELNMKVRYYSNQAETNVALLRIVETLSKAVK